MNKKEYRYVIGMDPSGAFNEGKGTTGWCVLDSNTNDLLQVGTLCATNYGDCHEYWQAHIDLIRALCKQYGIKTCLSIENYILYKSSAMDQVNSQMETVQLLGIIKHHCVMNAVPYYIRPAVAVKARWCDDILLHKKVIAKVGRYFIAKCRPTEKLCEHERDAIRHAMHCSVFELKGA